MRLQDHRGFFLWFFPAALFFGCFPLSYAAGGEKFFRGESCAVCHARIRDRQAPSVAGRTLEDPISVKEPYDVVVVGGGFSGLSAAYFLKDRKVLVLEKEDRPGGHGRAESWRGIPYPTGTVYFNSEPYEAWKTLFEDLHLKPHKVPSPVNLLMVNGQLVEDFLGEGASRLPYDPQTRAGFLRLWKFLRQAYEEDRFSFSFRAGDLESQRLEEETFWDHLVREYGGMVASHYDRFLQDMLGAGIREISAFAGFLMLNSEEDFYTWEDGTYTAVRALAKSLSERLKTGAWVTRVWQDGSGVNILYEQDGKNLQVRSRTAVLAIPAHVILSILQGMPREKEKALAQVRYSAYVVTMLGFREPVWTKSYMLWANDAIFTSLVFTDFPKYGTSKRRGPQVALAYMPMGSEAARRRLLQTGDAELKTALLRDLEKVIPGSSQKVEEVRIMRWGHAEPIPYPGYLSRVRPRVAQPWGRIFFAGEATQIPAMEGAILSGHRASQEARRFLEANR
ncbi:MAG: FAD-dependent oxidoreductase [Elusimicrobia bacterium]|nr:FAD-dependent oxidoreductase [Elusimicrobiota bacterium]